ncbi:deoxyribonuclease TATDN1-like isoform X2 [Eriocheir sinensis]|uniref:deoxyribonuclease TATDN1-like isoform X2 n=1 Tax=Eriocheir sinensis TaxID=95602 RepID=UPI0021C5FF1E|nr:deoxyribonuclease TATDN1-like isoform X2 [Eriocheir sinensis]
MSQHADVFAVLTSASYQGEQGRDSDLEHVLERAKDAGVRHIVSWCEDMHHALHALKLSRVAEGVHCAISLDPGVFSRRGMRAPYLKAVRRYAIRYRSEVLGVTSSGLKSYSSATQVRRLQRALGVAADQQLPVFVEWNKKIMPKFMPIFEDLVKMLPATVFHSFQGSEVEARTLLDKGFYLGISCRSVLVQQTLEGLAKLPLNQVLVHSGTPESNYLNDHPLVTTKFPAAPPTDWRPGLMLQGRGEPACVALSSLVVAYVYVSRPSDPAVR